MFDQIVNSLTQDSGITLGAVLGSLGMVCGTIICVAGIVSEAWRKVRQTEDNNLLKQDMLERGMSAEDIVTVMTAGQRKSRGIHVNVNKQPSGKWTWGWGCDTGAKQG